MPFRKLFRVAAALLAIPFLAGTLCVPMLAADKKDEKKEEKKEKTEPWTEIRTTHFVVASDGGEKTARRVADQFETVRRVFQATMPNAHFSTGIPIQILAARNAESFAKIFPEFPYDKRRGQQREPPAGLFVAGPEKVYIGIRTNASGRVPYEAIYRDYARLVLKLSYRNLPPWLEEGYLNVYGSLTINERGARLDHPDPEDLSVLFESPLLPVELVLQVDRKSAYYTVGEKNTVYFAESRALVHFLLTDPRISGSKVLDQYISKVEGGADSLVAARQVFVDLNQLQSKLETYVKETKSPPVDIGVAGGSDSGGPARMLSAAQAEARIADFLAHHGKRGDAEDMLEDALKLEPTLAEAEQSMGFLQMQQNHLDDADMHFARALELDPNDALTYYGQGQLAMTRGGFVGVPVGAVVAFEKTVSLNPDFAQAWFNLASIYATRNETLQKALTDAQRAASLEPGESGYQLQVASILDRLGRTDDARKTVAQVQAGSSDPKVANKAGDMLAQMTPKPAPPAAGAPAAPVPAAPSSAGIPRIERRTEPDQPAAAPPPVRSEPVSSVPPIAASSTRVYSMLGTITDVVCANAPQVKITLKAQTIVMHLHASDLGQVAIKSAGASVPAKSTSCASLRGRSVRVSYLLVSDQTWDGEMQSVEFR
jgi:tetratricopeptide (TPR) repeat protein